MKWHVFRPVGLVIAVVATILVSRIFLVPEDFGVHGDSFTYNFHRLSNVQEWKDFPVKYQGIDYCSKCHRRHARMLGRSTAHSEIICENCHGPGAGHPDEIESLPINTSRDHCLRCHALLDYPNNGRAAVPGIDDATHMKGKACVQCHNPHHPREE